MTKKEIFNDAFLEIPKNVYCLLFGNRLKMFSYGDFSYIQIFLDKEKYKFEFQLLEIFPWLKVFFSESKC